MISLPYGAHRFKGALPSLPKCEASWCDAPAERCPECFVAHCKDHRCDCHNLESEIVSDERAETEDDMEMARRPHRGDYR